MSYVELEEKAAKQMADQPWRPNSGVADIVHFNT